MQQSSQGFTFSLVKLGLYRLWSGGLLLEALDAFLFKRMDGITDGLRGSTQILSNDFGALFSTGGELDLAATQGKGIGGAQSSF